MTSYSPQTTEINASRRPAAALAYVRRNWAFLGAVSSLLVAAGAVLSGERMSWLMQLGWLGIGLGWIGVAALLKRTTRIQRETIELLQAKRQRDRAWLS